MERITVKLGELFEIDNGSYVSTWKMIIHGGILRCERQLNVDWENFEKKIDAEMEK